MWRGTPAFASPTLLQEKAGLGLHLRRAGRWAMVLGWQWILLPGLIMEAIPGLYVFPFWVLVVGAVAIWGTVRPKLNGQNLPQ